jgi:hypothetical protein
MFGEKLQYQIENLGLWFQGGVRRNILIFFVACLIIAAPGYFLAGQLSKSWFTAPFNPWGLKSESIIKDKYIPEQKLEISNTQTLDLKDGSRQFYVSISNKLNPLIGYFPFVYDLQILDSNNQLIDQKTETRYLLPEQVRFAIWEQPDSRGTKLQVIINKDKTKLVYYNPNSQTIKMPNLVVIDTGCKIRNQTPFMNVNFRAKNQSRFGVDNIDSVYLVYDSRGNIVGIGEFKFTDFKANEERTIDLPYLQPKTFIENTNNTSCSPLKIEVRLSVNFLDTGNFVN